MGASLRAGERVCVILLSGIGDVVHGLPIVNALKRDNPRRRITWIVQSEAAPLLSPHPAIDAVLTFDRRKGLGEVAALRRKLRPLAFDLVLNLNIYFKALIPTALARAPHKLGFGPDRARDLVWLSANHRLPPRAGGHTQDRFLEFLDYLGIAREPLEWRIAITDEERQRQSEFFAPAPAPLAGPPVVGLVPTSGRGLKDWPTERFGALARTLLHDFGWTVVLLGGPGARDAERARAVAEAAGRGTVWALGPELRRFIYIADRLDLLIAPDTGPVHIARALGTPVIGLYAHTNPITLGPYRACEDLWIDRYNFDAAGVPSRDRRPGGRGARMHLITVADVLEKVELAREKYLKRARSSEAPR
jgi:heptosyltransferase I